MSENIFIDGNFTFRNLAKEIKVCKRLDLNKDKKIALIEH